MTRAAVVREPQSGAESLHDVGDAEGASEADSPVRARCVALLHQVGVKSARKIDDQDELVADLALESVQILRLITLVEREFELLIDTHDLTGVKTVADLVGFIRARVQ